MERSRRKSRSKRKKTWRKRKNRRMNTCSAGHPGPARYTQRQYNCSRFPHGRRNCNHPHRSYYRRRSLHLQRPIHHRRLGYTTNRNSCSPSRVPWSSQRRTRRRSSCCSHRTTRRNREHNCRRRRLAGRIFRRCILPNSNRLQRSNCRRPACRKGCCHHWNRRLQEANESVRYG